MGNCLSASEPSAAASGKQADKPSSPTPVKKNTDAVPKASGPERPAAKKVQAAPVVDSTSSASYSANGGSELFGLFAKKDEEDKTFSLLGAKKSKVRLAQHGFDDSAAAADAQAPHISVLEGEAMTMWYRVIVASASTPIDEKSVQQCIDSVFALVDSKFNNWNPNSEINQLNALKAKKKMDASPEMHQLFALIDNVHTLSDGRFDPTVDPLIKIWTKSLVEYGHPCSSQDTSHLKFALGWKTKVTRKNLSVMLENSNTSIDLCGIVKGYAVDEILTRIQNARWVGNNKISIYVDWAGDIRSIGMHPTGRPWRSAVMQPPELKRLFDLWASDRMDLAVSEKDVQFFVDFPDSHGGAALATSGDYFRIQKFGYHHIYDITNHTPLKAGVGSLASVSVLASDCTTADSLATAGMTCGTVKAASAFFDGLMKSQPDTLLGYCLIGRSNGDVKYTSVFKRHNDYLESHGVKTKASDVSPAPGSLIGVEPAALKKRNTDSNKALFPAVLNQLPRTLCVVGVNQSGGKPFVTGVCGSVASCSLSPPSFSLLVDPSVLPVAVGTELHVAYLNENTRELVEASTNNSSSFVDWALKPGVQCKDAKDWQKMFGKVCAGMLGTVVKVESVDAHCAVAIVNPSSFTLMPKSGARLHGIGSRLVSGPIVAEKYICDSVAIEEDERLKRLMRSNRSPVCVVSVSSADGRAHALTASSVRTEPRTGASFAFNIQKGSVFRSSLGFEGSRVALHWLHPVQESLAEYHTKSVTLDTSRADSLSNVVSRDEMGSGWPPVIAGCAAVLICTVVCVTDAGDHLVYVCRATHVPEDLGTGVFLTYGNGNYSVLEG
ncbi:FAD:protein FMN transferase [Porphyridium purpureum]|uniref:FAD:protein FMN transferase n=1 Tax=Porphyridium purpureum TaxID=35688 RepID=A0A5J4YHV2_PORPP|nr:FAD:protein FMN transferase [Porphyridium purpureum]|eukprot:POR8441..scf289_17